MGIVHSTIGEMITATTAHILEADWGMAPQDACLADDVGANHSVRQRKSKKQNWLHAMLAAISRPFGAAWA